MLDPKEIINFPGEFAFLAGGKCPGNNLKKWGQSSEGPWVP